MRALYTLLLYLVAPVFWWQLRRRARREGGNWQILHPHRFGRHWQCTLPEAPVWVHAVSLGELRAAQPLIHRLLDAGEVVLLTHTTATAMNAGRHEFAGAIAQGRLQQAWLPYDFPRAVARFLAVARPRLGLLVEREIWPNLLAACRARGVTMVLINARLSARSARALGHWRSLWRPALGGLAAVLAQTRADGERLQSLGAPPAMITGNLKFDVVLDERALAIGQAWRRAWQRPVVMLASSRDGEEQMLCQALTETGLATPGARLKSHAATPFWLIVPRHARRFDALAQWLNDAGSGVGEAPGDPAAAAAGPLTSPPDDRSQPAPASARGNASWVRRSALAPGATPGIDGAVGMLGDTLGEMAIYYGAADVALLGGSFADFGGQNLVEACAAGVPVIMGSSLRNFAQAAADAEAAGAAVRVSSMHEAVQLAQRWLADDAGLAARSRQAREFVARHQGATARTLEYLQPWLAPRR